MKKIILALIVLSILGSCGDNLSNREAARIIQKCLGDKPDIREKSIGIGKQTFNSKKQNEMEDLYLLKQLAKKKYLVIDSINAEKRWGDSYNINYEVSLTDKAKEFVTKSTSRRATFRTCEFKLDKVRGMYEIATLHSMLVTVIFYKANKTPFHILENDKTEFEVRRVHLVKDADKWSRCEGL